MSDGPVPEALSLAHTRAAFDESFAMSARGRDRRESAILVRVGSHVFCIRSRHICGLAKGRRIVPLPSRIPELLGLIALRGSLVPVYDLAALLAVTPGASHPWVALVPGETPLGLAFDEFEGQLEAEWLADGQTASPREHFRPLARMGSAVRAVLDIPGLAQAIRKRAGIADPAKERKP
jgi:chemotaxis signal transduction protein